MIEVRVDDVQPHPDQATNNPGCWAVKLHVSYSGHSRTFWRWHDVKTLSSTGAYVETTSTKKPATSEIVARFWDDTFAELHGFDFDPEEEE